MAAPPVQVIELAPPRSSPGVLALKVAVGGALVVGGLYVSSKVLQSLKPPVGIGCSPNLYGIWPFCGPAAGAGGGGGAFAFTASSDGKCKLSGFATGATPNGAYTLYSSLSANGAGASPFSGPGSTGNFDNGGSVTIGITLAEVCGSWYVAVKDNTTGAFSSWVGVTTCCGTCCGSGGGGGGQCPSPPGPGPCNPICPDCPSTDICASIFPGGVCGQGTAPDPNYPGCCTSTCPGSCTSDSDCAGCGSGAYCACGSCASSKIPDSIAPPTGNIETNDTLTWCSCCVPPLGPCNVCNSSDDFQAGAVKVQVLDRNKCPLPNAKVALDVSPSPSPGASFTWTIYGADGGTSSPYLTDANGEVTLVVTPTSKPSDNGTDWTPCGACSGSYPHGSIGTTLGLIEVIVHATGQGQLFTIDFTVYQDALAYPCAGNCPAGCI